MTPARRRQLLQQMASQNTASGVAMIRRQAENEEARDAQEAAGNPPAAVPFAEPSPVAFRRLYRDGVLIATVGPDVDLTDPPAEPVTHGTLEEQARRELETTGRDLLQEIRDEIAESLPAVPFIAPKKRRRRRKKSAADAPRKPGRPALGEAGPAARVSVSLAPETMAAVRAAARRRKVKLGTVIRELAEAWAAR